MLLYTSLNCSVFQAHKLACCGLNTACYPKVYEGHENMGFETKILSNFHSSLPYIIAIHLDIDLELLLSERNNVVSNFSGLSSSGLSLSRSSQWTLFRPLDHPLLYNPFAQNSATLINPCYKSCKLYLTVGLTLTMNTSTRNVLTTSSTSDSHILMIFFWCFFSFLLIQLNDWMCSELSKLPCWHILLPSRVHLHLRQKLWFSSRPPLPRSP